MRRRLLIVLGVVALAAVVYKLVLSDEAVAPTLVDARPTAVIGSGEEAVGVGADGALLVWLPAPKEGTLPELPLSEPPKEWRLAGPVLEQARVLGAAPAPLRPYLQGTRYGETGVDVVLKVGVELGFGDDSQVARKWRTAAALLASPEVTSVDYVNLHAPARPSLDGSSHTLPSVP